MEKLTFMPHSTTCVNSKQAFQVDKVEKCVVVYELCLLYDYCYTLCQKGPLCYHSERKYIFIIFGRCIYYEKFATRRL